LPTETAIPPAYDLKGAKSAPLDDIETVQDLHPKRPAQGTKSASKGCKIRGERVQNTTPKGAGGAPKGAPPAPEPRRTSNEPGREPIERANSSIDDLLFDGKTAQPAPASPKRVRALPRKPETPIDPEWQPDAKGIAYAIAKGITDVPGQVEQFVNKHLAKGTLHVSWPAAWQYWCGNFRTFQPRAAAAPAPTNGGGLMGALKRAAPFTGTTIDE
jgi:hypothetical protein